MAESLAVKFRPQEWESVCGQKSIIKILTRQLETNSLKNAYLFAGASGCGKTTLARIFANKINNNTGSAIEIDGASNNGVDNVKTIIKSAQERSIDSKYKIYIVDECFEGNTMISTPLGDVAIKDISPNDIVYTLEGPKKVLYKHKLSTVSDNMLKVRLSNKKSIYLTKGHYLLTTDGWITAENLLVGDILVDYETVSNMWEDIQQSESNMLKKLWEKIELGTPQDFTSPENVYTYMCNMWKRMGNCIQELSSNMLEGVLFQVAINETKGILCFRSWDGTKEFSLKKSNGNYRICNKDSTTTNGMLLKNEDSKPYVKYRQYTEDDTHQRIEWDIASVEGTPRGEWRIYSSPDAFIREIGRFLEIGIPNQDISQKGEYTGISYELQSRPCLSFGEVSNRGGWQEPLLEKAASIRCQKGRMSDTIRVESVEIYQRADIDGHRTNSNENIEVYDLTIEGCPNYFVNGVLAHNCHMITTQGWNAFLKCIEEPPAFTIFIFCTTDPQKIPATILNRVQRYNITRISTDQVEERLRYICEQEGYINYEESIDYISKLCDGGMRDSISTLEKCAGYSSNLCIENTLNALGNYSYDTFFTLVNSIIDGNVAKVLSVLDEFYSTGNDLKLFIEQFLTFCLDISKYIVFESCDLIKIPSSMEKILKDSTNFEDSLNYYMYIVNQLLELKNMLKNDSNIKTTIEVMFLKMARMQ